MLFPRKIIFNFSAQLFVFFDGSLQGYGACAYPQKSRSRQELFNVTLSSPVFIGDSEIILKMIAKQRSSWTSSVLWNYTHDYLPCPCPTTGFGGLDLADLLTRSGSTCDLINSDFWLHGSFLPQLKSSWPTKSYASLPACDFSSRTINIIAALPINQSSDLTISLMQHNQSLSKVIKALTLINKSCRTWRQNPEPIAPWNSILSKPPSSHTCHQPQPQKQLLLPTS